MRIERAHCLPGKNKPRPLIVKFSFFKDKDRVIKRYLQLRKSDPETPSSANVTNDASAAESDSGNRVNVSKYFPESIHKDRSAFILFLKQSIDARENTYLRFDKLIVNGNSDVYDETRQRTTPSLKQDTGRSPCIFENTFVINNDM